LFLKLYEFFDRSFLVSTNSFSDSYHFWKKGAKYLLKCSFYTIFISLLLFLHFFFYWNRTFCVTCIFWPHITIFIRKKEYKNLHLRLICQSDYKSMQIHDLISILVLINAITIFFFPVWIISCNNNMHIKICHTKLI
jgi:hypothetical protein